MFIGYIYMCSCNTLAISSCLLSRDKKFLIRICQRGEILVIEERSAVVVLSGEAKSYCQEAKVSHCAVQSILKKKEEN